MAMLGGSLFDDPLYEELHDVGLGVLDPIAYHLRCLREDATDPALSAAERLTLVGDRARRIRDIRQMYEQLRRPS